MERILFIPLFWGFLTLLLLIISIKAIQYFAPTKLAIIQAILIVITLFICLNNFIFILFDMYFVN